MPVYVCRCQVERQDKTCAQACNSFYLLRCPCVCRVPVRVKATHVGYTYAVLVMAATMRAGFLYRPAGFYCSIRLYQKVIAYACPPSLPVPPVHVRNVNHCTGPGGGAVDNNFVYLSHSVFFRLRRGVKRIKG